MPRIRTIKPEFWDSPSTANAGPWARLAFIALWNWADDFGRGTANLKELEGFVFPNDSEFTDKNGEPTDFRGILRELAGAYGVVFYEVEGRSYYAIPSWDRHERTDRRGKGSKYPPPPANPDLTRGYADLQESAGISRENLDGPTGSCLEQGNRGTGEQSFLGTASETRAVDNSEAKASSSKQKRATRLPDDWKPSATPGNQKAEQGHDPAWLDRELERFRDYWAGVSGQRGRKLDWDATWRNWLRNAEDRKPRQQSFGQPRTAGSLTEDDWEAMLTEAERRDALDARRAS